MVKKRTSTGRKKVELKRIDKEEARHVSFSKRRQGLFNKANELSILCGAMVGCVVFSPAGRPYSCGHPSVEAVMSRFLAPNPPNVPASGGMTETARMLLEQYTELQGLVEKEMKREESLKEAIDKEMGSRMMQWLNTNICDLGADELLEFNKELHVIHGVVQGQANQVHPMDIASSSQYQFGEQSAMPMYDGFIDGIAVNDPLLTGIYRDGGPENFPNNQNVG